MLLNPIYLSTGKSCNLRIKQFFITRNKKKIILILQSGNSDS